MKTLHWVILLVVVAIGSTVALWFVAVTPETKKSLKRLKMNYCCAFDPHSKRFN